MIKTKPRLPMSNEKAFVDVIKDPELKRVFIHLLHQIDAVDKIQWTGISNLNKRVDALEEKKGIEEEPIVVSERCPDCDIQMVYDESIDDNVCPECGE